MKFTIKKKQKPNLSILGLMIVMIIALFASKSWAALSDGLVMHWTLDEGTGTTVKDSSPNAVQGGLFNGAAWVAGNVGTKAVFLNGVSTYIESSGSAVATKLNGVKQMSISLWVNPTSGYPLIYRWGTHRQFGVEFLPDRGIIVRWRIGGTGGAGTTFEHIIPFNKMTGWHHMVIIYNDPVSTVYINGTKFELTGPGGALNTGIADNLVLGKSNTGIYLQGSLDDVRVYNRVLIETEVADLRALGKDKGLTPTLVTSGTNTNTNTPQPQDVNTGTDRLLKVIADDNVPYCANGINTACRDFKTIQTCANAAKPGDTCQVFAGNYPEYVLIASGGAATDPAACRMIKGTYPDFTYSDGNCDAKRITFKAMGAVKVLGFDIRNSFVTVDGFTMTGVLQFYQSYIYLKGSLSNVQIINNTIINGSPNVYGISFAPTSQINPEITDILIQNNTINNLGYHFASLYGQRILFKNNILKNLNGWDVFRAFGHDNVIRRNIIQDGIPLPNIGNHPDFIQSFSDNGGEGYNYLIEENWVNNLAEGYQLGQMNSGGGRRRPVLDPNFRDFTFRRNVFNIIGNNFNGGLPGLHFLQNTFIRLSFTQGGLNFGGSSMRGFAEDAVIKNNVFFDSGTKDAGGMTGYYANAGHNLSREVIARDVTKEDLENAYPYPLADILWDDLVLNEYINSNGSPQAKAKALTSVTQFVMSNGEYVGYKDALYKALIVAVVLDQKTRSSFVNDYNFVAMGKADNYASKDGFVEVHGVNGGDPGFSNLADPDGADNIPFTLDDGIKPKMGSRICGKGEKDVLGKAIDIGVYSCDPDTVFSGGSPVILNVVKTGLGNGRVAGAGLDCGSKCAVNVTSDSSVTLYADPDNQSIFEGWQGVSTCKDKLPCKLIVTNKLTVTANFSSADCSRADVRCVDDDNKAIANGTSKEYATIQACINASVAGDTCLVYPGQYPENLDVTIPNLRIVALNDATNKNVIQSQKSTIKGFRLMQPNVTIKGFDIAKYDFGTNPAYGSVDPEADMCEIRNNVFRDGIYLTSTNMYFRSADTRFNPPVKTIENPSGGFIAAGFKEGLDIYIGSNINVQIKNHDTVKRILKVTDTILVVSDVIPAQIPTGLNCEDNFTMRDDGPVKSTIYVSRGEKVGVRGIALAASSTRGTPDQCVIEGNRLTNLAGHAVVINGNQHQVLNNTFDHMNGWRMIGLFGNNNRIAFNVFRDSKRWPDFELPLQGTVHCMSSGSWDMYDALISSYPSSDQTIYDNTFENNFILDIDEQFATVEDKSPLDANLLPTRGLNIRNNVFVGLEMTGSFTRPETRMVNNTFYRNAWRSEHNFSIGPSAHGVPTDSIIKNNVFIGSGVQPDPTGKRGWYLADLTILAEKPDYNFVADGKATGYLAKPGFKDLEEHTDVLGFNGSDPQFQNPDDPLGPDGLPFTSDDGLRPRATSPLCRVAQGGADVGAYECAQCTDVRPLAYFVYDEPDRRAPVDVNFNAGLSVSCVTDTQMTYTWDFGDGTTGTGQNVTHNFKDGGVFKVTLTVKNGANYVGTKTRNVMVEYPPTPGQIMYLNFDDNVSDWTGSFPFRTSWSGASSYVDILSGKAASLTSAVNSYPVTYDHEALGSMPALTLGAWIKKSAANNAGTIMLKLGSYRFRFTATGFNVTLYNDARVSKSVTATTTANNDTLWHHYVVTYDGAMIKLYLDGKLITSQTGLTGKIGITPGQPLYYGIESGSALPMDALLDDVTIYNTNLDDAGVSKLYSDTKISKIASTNGTIKWGDVNKSGSVSTYDASLVMKKVMGINFSDTYDAVAADVSGDGTVSVYDAALIARYAIGIINIFPAEQ